MKNLLIAAALSLLLPRALLANQLEVAHAKTAQIDINRATAEELKSPKGMVDARAEAIIKGRPYKRKD